MHADLERRLDLNEPIPGQEWHDASLPQAGGVVVEPSNEDADDEFGDFDEEDFDDDFDDDFEEEAEDEYEPDNEEYPDATFGEEINGDEDLEGVEIDESIEGEFEDGEAEEVEPGEAAEGEEEEPPAEE